MINKQFGDGNPLNFNFSAHEETIKRLEEEIEALQNDYYVFKEKIDKQYNETQLLLRKN